MPMINLFFYKRNLGGLLKDSEESGLSCIQAALIILLFSGLRIEPLVDFIILGILGI